MIKLGRINGHLFQKLHQAQVAGAYKRRDTQGEGSLQTDDAARGSSDGTAFFLLAVRGVICGDDIYGAVGQPGDDRLPVFFVRKGGFIFASVPYFRTASSVRVKW